MKKYMQNKLNGFTLIELIIALLISSVVIFTAITIITITNKTSSKYLINSKMISDLLMFKKSLNHDCYHSRGDVFLDKNTINLELGNYITKYEFKKNCVIKYLQQSIDTFHVTPYDVSINKKKIGDHYIYAIEMEIGIGNDTIPLLCIANSTNRFLINKTTK